MTDNLNVDPDRQPTATGSRRILKWVVAAAIAVPLLTVFRYALRHGEHVKAVRQRGLETFAAGLVVREAANRSSSNGFFPPWDPRPGVLFYDRSHVNSLYDLGPRMDWALRNPDDRALVTVNLVDNRVGYRLEDFPESSRYFYLPYAVRNETEGLALLDSYRQAATGGGTWTDSLPAPAGQGTGGTDTFYRLHRTLQQDLKETHRDLPEEHFLREQFPSLIERPMDSGGWVVFFDRDPVWMDYPGEFPMTERFISALTALESELRTEAGSQTGLTPLSQRTAERPETTSAQN